MTKFFSSLRSAAKVIAAGLFSSVLLISCLKDKHDDTPAIPVAGLMAFNLSPDKAAIGFELSGSNLTKDPLGYTGYTGNYLSIYPGARSVNAYDFYTQAGTVATIPGNFDTDKFYSVFLVGAGSVYKNVLVRDNVDSLSASTGQAYIRYINAIPDSVSAPAITVTANGITVINNPVAFANISEFTAVNAGDITISLKNNSGIDVNRTIVVEQKKVYTILLIGKPNSSSTPVEIKYITNGTLSDSTNKTAVNGQVTEVN